MPDYFIWVSFMKNCVSISFCLFCTSAFSQGNFSNGMKKVLTTMNIINQMYVDKVDDSKLADDAVKALISELDPHSTYMSKEEVKEMNERLEGNFTGIGVSFNMITDTLYVIETISGGPSAKSGNYGRRQNRESE